MKFDQIYHEHVSYFTSKNIKSILNHNKFNLIGITRNKYHGGSLRSIASKKIQNFEIETNLRQIKDYNEIYKINFYKK